MLLFPDFILQKYHWFYKLRDKRNPVHPLLLYRWAIFSLLLWQSIKYPEYYTGERESEIVLGYLDIIQLQSISSELNWDFLSHIQADDDSTCDACLLGGDLEFSFSLLLVGITGCDEE